MQNTGPQFQGPTATTARLYPWSSLQSIGDGNSRRALVLGDSLQDLRAGKREKRQSVPRGDAEGLGRVGGGIKVRVENKENVENMTVVPVTWS